MNSNLSVSNLVKELVNKLINNFSDLYNLDKDDIAPLDRMGDKSAQNIIDAINKSKNTTLARYINGLGIRNVGLNASKLLEKSFDGNLDSLMKSSKEELLKIKLG